MRNCLSIAAKLLGRKSTEDCTVVFYDFLRSHMTVQVIKMVKRHKIVVFAIPTHIYNTKTSPFSFNALQFAICQSLDTTTDNLLQQGVLNEHNLADVLVSVKYDYSQTKMFVAASKKLCSLLYVLNFFHRVLHYKIQVLWNTGYE